MPVTYVTADIAGVMESPVYAVLQLGPEIDKFKIQPAIRSSSMAAIPSDPEPLFDEMGWRVAHHL